MDVFMHSMDVWGTDGICYEFPNNPTASVYTMHMHTAKAQSLIAFVVSCGEQRRQLRRMKNFRIRK